MTTCGEVSVILNTSAQQIISLRFSNNLNTVVLPSLNIAGLVIVCKNKIWTWNFGCADKHYDEYCFACTWVFPALRKGK